MMPARLTLEYQGMNDNPYQPPTIPPEEVVVRKQRQRSHIMSLAMMVALGCIIGFFASGRIPFPEEGSDTNILLRIVISMICGGLIGMLAQLAWRKLRSSSPSDTH